MVSLKGDGKMIFMIFIGALITVVFLGAVANSIFAQTNTITVTNETQTAAAINSSITLTGRSNITPITVVNASSDAADWTGNFTVSTTDSDGDLGIFLFSRNVTGAGFAGESIGVSYTYEPFGYIQDSGARSVTLLIVIIGALAIVVFIIVVMLKFGSLREMMNSFGRRRTR